MVKFVKETFETDIDVDDLVLEFSTVTKQVYQVSQKY